MRWWLVGLGGLLALGCTRFGGTQTALYGPYTGQSSEALLQRSADALVARGYNVETMEPRSGRLTVRARTQVGFRAPATFRVQVYREGWVQLIPEGSYVQGAGVGRVTMPSSLLDEYVQLAEGLMPPAGDR